MSLTLCLAFTLQKQQKLLFYAHATVLAGEGGGVNRLFHDDNFFRNSLDKPPKPELQKCFHRWSQLSKNVSKTLYH